MHKSAGQHTCTTWPDNVSETIPVILLPPQVQGTERQDNIGGIHLAYRGQPFNRNGYGGYPMDLSVYLEKEKKTLNVQVRDGNHTHDCI